MKIIIILVYITLASFIISMINYKRKHDIEHQYKKFELLAMYIGRQLYGTCKECERKNTIIDQYMIMSRKPYFSFSQK